MGLCKKYKAKRPVSGGRYESGQFRCQICTLYMTISGTKDNEGIYCKCCNYKVRGKPRNKFYKEKLRDSSTNKKNCPSCKLTANTSQEIEILFGYRKMKSGSIIPQSYCRTCRSGKSKKHPLLEKNSELVNDSDEIKTLHDFLKNEKENTREIINFLTQLYEQHSKIETVYKKTGIPPHLIRKYVKFVRLPNLLKNEFEIGTISLDLGLRATDALDWDGQKKDEQKVLDLAILMRSLNSEQRKIVEDLIKKDNTLSMSQISKTLAMNS